MLYAICFLSLDFVFSVVFYASGDHMMETYSSTGLVMALYVASIVLSPPMLLI